MRLRHSIILTLLLLLSSPTWSQYKIVPSGDPIIDKIALKYTSKTVNIRELDEIIKELTQDGLFQIVYAELIQKNKVKIRVQQSNKLQKIVIEGNNKLNDNDIFEFLQIQPNQLLSDLEITQSLEKLKKEYNDLGFYNFKVNSKKTTTVQESILTVNISEGHPCTVKEIRVYSKNEKLNKLLNLEVKQFEEANYETNTTQSLQKKIDDFLLTNRYLTAKASEIKTIFNKEKTRVKINITINNPIQYEFIFTGNSFYSHFDFIKETEIGTKFLYLSDASTEIQNQIKNYYLMKGFPEAKIKFSQQFYSKQQKKVLVFNITEGPRVRVGQIQIFGKISNKKSYYSNLFLQKLSQQTHSVYFVKKDVEAAAEAMITDLKRAGHLQAELLSLTFDLNNTGYANINIQIDEGIMTYVRQILFRGAKSFSNILLTEQIDIKANKPLIIEDIENSFDKLNHFYQDKGYLEFKIKNPNASVIQYNKGQPYADIVYQIEEGPQIVVKDINLKGTKKTHNYVIFRELDFKTGDILTLSKVTNSIDRLEKMGLFGKVNIRSLEQGSSKRERTVIVELDERKPGLFSSGVGLANQGLMTYRGYIGTIYNNLWGKARAFSSRVDLNYRKGVNYFENRVALSYYEPFIFENRMRGRISLTREQQLSDYIENDSTILSTNQIRLSTEKTFSRQFRFIYNVWGLSNQETFRVRDKTNILTTTNVATTGPVFEFDYRNDPFLPTDGSYSRFDFEYSDPILGSSRDNPSESGFTGGLRNDKRTEINFFKTTLSTTHYIPLTKSKNWVWANSLRGGYLKNVSSRVDSGIPRINSFFLGGSSTIRGFSIGTTETIPGKRELCLKQNLIDFSDGTEQCQFDNVFTRDDSTFFLIKSELRFPLSGGIGGLIFYDGGGVYLGEFDLEDPYRDSVGVGIRLATPVGALVFEVGYKLDRKAGGPNSFFDPESDIAFHLAIGNF